MHYWMHGKIDEEKAEGLNTSFVLVVRLSCPQGTQPPRLKDRDEEQSEVPTIQEETVACYST